LIFHLGEVALSAINVYGIQHIGLTVPDMLEAVHFFETVFGSVICMSTGPLNVEDAFMARKLGVPPHTRIKDIKVLRCGRGTNLELFEYQGENSNTPLKRNSESGGWHIAFEVDDAVASAQRLRDIGVDVLDGPTYVEAGPMKGLTWVYLRAPWGQFLELVSIEGHMGYEDEGGPKLWSPRD
jgi:catechol 2,3-dioxygenase-like lactoylglutathione lyase family enzyme